ncbi:MFS transporter, partial [Blautia obeum]|nr:MFS transporter [Blautia obeum]
LAVSVLFGWLLVRVERQVEHPTLDLSVLKVPAVAAAAISRAVVSFAFFGALYYLTLFLQSVQGYSAFETGLILMPS